MKIPALPDPREMHSSGRFVPFDVFRIFQLSWFGKDLRNLDGYFFLCFLPFLTRNFLICTLAKELHLIQPYTNVDVILNYVLISIHHYNSKSNLFMYRYLGSPYHFFLPFFLQKKASLLRTAIPAIECNTKSRPGGNS